jgi:hypothetical protein
MGKSDRFATQSKNDREPARQKAGSNNAVPGTIYAIASPIRASLRRRRLFGFTHEERARADRTFENAHAGSHRRTVPAAAESILKKAAKLGLSIKGREAKGK